MRSALACTVALCPLLSVTASGDDAPVRRSLLDRAPTLVAEAFDFQADGDTVASRSVPPYGVAGTAHWTVGLRTARDLDSDQDTALFGQYTFFIADDVEVGLEAGAWLILQRNDTVAASFSVIGRYHFYQQPSYSIFVDTALGLMLAGERVPDAGTSFNLMPRVGIGMTSKIGDAGARLVYGLHWHHISNARLGGAENNPARDGLGVYFSIAFPF